MGNDNEISAGYAWWIGFIIGLIVSGFVYLGLQWYYVTSLRALKKSAIEKGYAEMKLIKPTDTKAVFTWIEPKEKKDE